MITLNGTVHRQFYFPADPLTTMVYFSDLDRATFHLPHITLVETYTDKGHAFAIRRSGSALHDQYLRPQLTVDVAS
jgi:hypothetical protein